MTSATPDVVVVGDALLDVTAHPQTPMRAREDVPATVRIGCGGQGANLAVRLARRGARVELVCALGDDPGGRIVRDALAREDVALCLVTTPLTGTVVILLDEAGERSMLSQRAPFAAEAASAVRDDAGWLVVSGYLLLETDADVLARTLSSLPARRALVGCTVPGGLVDRWVRAAAALRPDLVILNRDEALALVPGASAADDLPALLATLLRSGVTVTDASGATARLNGVSADVRISAEVSANDTTGAGDAFAAALVDGLRRSAWPPTAASLREALAAAAALASTVALAAGAQGRVPGEPGP